MSALYIFLGAAGSGRREILLDLIANGIEEGEGSTAVYVSEDEAPSPVDEALHSVPHCSMLTYRLEDDTAINAEPAPSDAGTVFFLTDGRADPADQIEAIKDWMEEHELELARILTVVNCTLAEARPALAAWFEACVHFSDVVFLNKREGVPQKWLKQFRDYYRKNRFPSLFELVKKGRVANPAAALYPEPRRLSLLFDEMDSDDTVPDVFSDIIIEGDFADEDDDAFDPENAADPYLERLDNGRRVRVLPDIADYLPAAET